MSLFQFVKDEGYHIMLFLLSKRAEYITGQTLTVDGGATLGVSGDSLPDVVTNPAIRKQFE
mgnify:CR=1 FL=1